MEKVFKIEWNKNLIKSITEEMVWDCLIYKFGILGNAIRVTELPQPAVLSREEIEKIIFEIKLPHFTEDEDLSNRPEYLTMAECSVIASALTGHIAKPKEYCECKEPYPFQGICNKCLKPPKPPQPDEVEQLSEETWDNNLSHNYGSVYSMAIENRRKLNELIRALNRGRRER